MSAELPKEKNHSLIFLGSCRHCNNATLIHVLELNIQTCAYCHHQTPISDSLSNPPTKENQHCEIANTNTA
ncbi:hypothetical protein MD588_12985 [Photobacterium sp. SDRW27]|uniref:hypothetical protein n=1 Tax=Photobacterium obscurum TaxID=2829490 RepID=UPI0022434F0C|nr:hypothetical protein [Photobacterium obscurum]MCW8329725.1 hypothetical protein [Photobacterium obscurum]